MTNERCRMMSRTRMPEKSKRRTSICVSTASSVPSSLPTSSRVRSSSSVTSGRFSFIRRLSAKFINLESPPNSQTTGNRSFWMTAMGRALITAVSLGRSAAKVLGIISLKMMTRTLTRAVA